MSQPFGAPPQGAQQPVPPPGNPGAGVDRARILTLLAAGAGLVGYLIAFFDTTAAQAMTSLVGFTIIATAVLVGLRLLPKVPNTLLAAAPLAAYAVFNLLLNVVNGSRGWSILALLLLSAVQLTATVWMLVYAPSTEGSRQPTARPAPAQGFPPPGQPPYSQPAPHPQQPGHPWNYQGPPPHPAPAPRPAQPGQVGQQQPPWWPAQSSGHSQPGGADPSSGGFPAPVHPASPPSGQPAQPGNGVQPPAHDPQSGPQGTQQMPHPGKAD